MREYDTLSGLFLLTVSVAILFGSLQLQVGTLTAPGSEFFPLLTGLMLGLFPILILVQARRGSTESIRFWALAADRKGISPSSLFILVYALLLERLGFILSTTLFFVSFWRRVSRHAWPAGVFFVLAPSLATGDVLVHGDGPDPLPAAPLGQETGKPGHP